MKTTATYLVALRAKTGERNALLNLDPRAKESLVPLFEVNRSKPSRPIEEHFEATVELIKQAWASEGEFLLDMSDVPSDARGADGAHPVQMLDLLCQQMSLAPTWCYALDRSDHDYEEALFAALARQRERSVAIRLQQHDLLFFEEAEARIRGFLSRAQVDLSRLWIVVDLLAIDASTAGGIELIRSRLIQLQAMSPGRLALLASSMWESARLPSDKTTRIRRHEVALWESLLRDVPTLVYGDYGVVHPRFADAPSTGVTIPAPKARYALPGEWVVLKGRRPTKGESSQYRNIAQGIIQADWFRTNEFGWGAENIRLAASGQSGPGNHTSWIGYCTELHLTLTCRQVQVAVTRARATPVARADDRERAIVSNERGSLGEPPRI
jgi:hypothetical protein